MFGRLSWPAASVVAWLIAKGACPLMLPRSRAVAAAAPTEVAVLAAVFVPRSVSETPWDATIAEALAVLAAWGGRRDAPVAAAIRHRESGNRGPSAAPGRARCPCPRAHLDRPRAA